MPGFQFSRSFITLFQRNVEIISKLSFSWFYILVTLLLSTELVDYRKNTWVHVQKPPPFMGKYRA